MLKISYFKATGKDFVFSLKTAVRLMLLKVNAEPLIFPPMPGMKEHLAIADLIFQV